MFAVIAGLDPAKFSSATFDDGKINTAVILRRSPFFTASLEGWATGARGRPSRRRASAAPQDDG
jgi:hypothetical protein